MQPTEDNKPCGDQAAPAGVRSADQQSEAICHLLARIVGEAPKDAPPVLTATAILARAAADGLVNEILGFPKNARKALGDRLRRLMGRHMVDAQGRAFYFVRRQERAGQSYAVRFL